MDPYYFYYLSKFVIVDFVGKTASSKFNDWYRNSKLLFKRKFETFVPKLQT